jgi:hypothetical protein
METFTFRSVEQDGTIREVELTAGQALDLNSGKPIAYTVHDETILVDDDGKITCRESAIPVRSDD